MTLIFKSGISGKPTLQISMNDYLNRKIKREIFTKFDHLVVEECSTETSFVFLDNSLWNNLLTVTIPLKPVTSTLAPISSSENFSNNLRTNGILAKIWKYLFRAKLVNAVPNLRVTALEDEKKRIRRKISRCSMSYISGISGSLANSFCCCSRSFSLICSSSRCTICAEWCWAKIGLSFFGS